MGVSPDTKRKSCGLYPMAVSNTFSKMGHNARPKGRSSVGTPTSSQSGLDMSGPWGGFEGNRRGFEMRRLAKREG